MIGGINCRLIGLSICSVMELRVNTFIMLHFGMTYSKIELFLKTFMHKIKMALIMPTSQSLTHKSQDIQWVYNEELPVLFYNIA